jgi:large subunit ribosomal protein L4
VAEEKKTPKPRAPRAGGVGRAQAKPSTADRGARPPQIKKVEANEVSAEIPMMAEALTPEAEEPKKRAPKAAAAKAPKAAAKKPAAKKKGDSPLDVQVYDSKGAEAGELRLPESIFGLTPNLGVMHQALQRQLNNARQGTSATKTRGLVSGGGRKPFRQKGLGRSRHGSEREPSMVGGGTVFGPQPRSYRQEMPRKMRRLALRSALSVKASEGRVSVIEGFAEMEVPKTRTIVELLESVGAEGTTLVVLASANQVVSRSAANLPWAKTILAHNLNLYDLFTHDHVVIAKDALELIEETFQA